MKIMVALDLTDYADFVLIKAIKTAKQQNAKMDIMVVVEDKSDTSVSAESKQVKEKLIKDATLAARSYQQKALGQGIKAKIRVRSGNSAAEEILKYQKLEKLDLIVLGRRSHTHNATLPIGTVAQKVVAYATCSVMVVRQMERLEPRFES